MFNFGLSQIFRVIKSLHPFGKFCLWAFMIAIDVSVVIWQFVNFVHLEKRLLNQSYADKEIKRITGKPVLQGHQFFLMENDRKRRVTLQKRGKINVKCKELHPIIFTLADPKSGHVGGWRSPTGNPGSATD